MLKQFNKIFQTSISFFFFNPSICKSVSIFDDNRKHQFFKTLSHCFTLNTLLIMTHMLPTMKTHKALHCSSLGHKTVKLLTSKSLLLYTSEVIQFGFECRQGIPFCLHPCHILEEICCQIWVADL